MTVRAGGCEHSIRETFFEIDEWDRVKTMASSTIDRMREKTDFVKAAYAHDPMYSSPEEVVANDQTLITEHESTQALILAAAHHELETCSCRCEACEEIRANTTMQPDPFGMSHPTTVPKHPDCRITGPPTTPEGDVRAHRAMGYTRERDTYPEYKGSRKAITHDEPPESDDDNTTADESMSEKLTFSADDASLFITDSTDEVEEKIEEHDIETFEYSGPITHGGKIEYDDEPFTMGEMTVDAGDLITDAIEEHAKQSAERAEEIAEAMDEADHHIEFDMTATGKDRFHDEADPGEPDEPRPERRDGDADRLEGDESPVPDPEAGAPSDGAKAPDDGEAPVARMGQPDLDPLGDDDFWS